MSNQRLSVICSGQAGQRPDMFEGFLKKPGMAELLEIASEALGHKFEAWLRGLGANDFFTNRNAQFLIALYQCMVWKRVSKMLPEPVLIIGYSVGELVAYHIAGAVDARELLRLVLLRAGLMDAASVGLNKTGGCMLVLRGNVSKYLQGTGVQAAGKDTLDTAIARTPEEVVLSGPSDEIDRFLERNDFSGVQALRIPVSVPAHSRYLSGASEAYACILLESSMTAPRIPVLSGVNGSKVSTREQAIDALSRQISTTLRWDQCMDILYESGIDVAIELGPGSDLAKLLARQHPRIKVRALSEFHDWRSVHNWVCDQGLR